MIIKKRKEKENVVVNEKGTSHSLTLSLQERTAACANSKNAAGKTD